MSLICRISRPKGEVLQPSTPITSKSDNAYTHQEGFSKEIHRDNHYFIKKRVEM